MVVLHTGKFIDFCRGPHIPSTSASGVQAEERRRATGRARKAIPSSTKFTRWLSSRKKSCDCALARIEEANAGYHRQARHGTRPLHIQKKPRQASFWHPKGGLIAPSWKRLRDEFAHARLRPRLQPTYCASILETIGHTGFYKDSSLAPVEVGKNRRQLKPMNCPGHILIYKQGCQPTASCLPSCDTFTVYRYERAGCSTAFSAPRLHYDDSHILPACPRN